MPLERACGSGGVVVVDIALGSGWMGGEAWGERPPCLFKRG
jgi:hypothetical protein